MGSDRDDFTPKTKRKLLERAGGHCSNPDCRRLTLKPASNPEESVREGVAAHIHAASPGGPRHDPGQTSEQRASIQNGIWLCRQCAWRVDQEPEEYTAEVLLAWKERHEAWILEDGGLEPLPEIAWETLEGLLTPNEGGTLQGDDFETFQDHRLAISNEGDKPIEGIELRIQFPEMLHPIDAKASPHNQVGVAPDRGQMVASGTGGGKVTSPPETPWFENYLVSLGLLHPREAVEITFRSKLHEHMGEMRMIRVPKNNERDPVFFYLEGRCVIAGAQRKFVREFVKPFVIDAEERRAHLEETVDKPCPFQLTREMLWHP